MMSVGAEPFPTAVALVVIGVLMLLSVLLSRASGRVGMPVSLFFLGLGMLSGEQGLGGIKFANFGFTFRLGTVALVLILFDGGLNTPLKIIRQGLKPAMALASFGVLGTAALVAVCAHWMGFSWQEGCLLGAIVSPTDAAVVFNVLRGSGVHLKERLSATLEMESGLNDPIAVILTVALTQIVYQGRPLHWHMLLEIPIHIGVGLVFGIGLGHFGRLLFVRARLGAGGLYPILSLALAALAFGVPTLFHGSGFLSVYVASVILGNGPMPYRTGTLHVHNSVAWLAQIAMFLLLGLLVFPSHLVTVAPYGLGLGLFLAFVARPLVVFACLAPFRFPLRDMAYVSWVGLRGAVPIILATYPILAHGAGAQRLFDVVFFVVVVNAFIPGGTVPYITRKLGLISSAAPTPAAILEISTTQLLAGDVMAFYIEESSTVCGKLISSLSFPKGASVLLAVRGSELIAPKGSTVLQDGDHVYVFCRSADKKQMRSLFGPDR
jgi:cell volume regulation protein A